MQKKNFTYIQETGVTGLFNDCNDMDIDDIYINKYVLYHHIYNLCADRCSSRLIRFIQVFKIFNLYKFIYHTIHTYNIIYTKY